MAITLGGGGSASQVNETIDIHSYENLITLADGRVYLKGGVTSTDTSTYPDATAAFAYTGTSFSTAGQASDESDLGWDGTYFWLLDRGNNAVYKYSAGGVYQNVSFSVASQDTNMYGIVCVGTDFYMVGTSSGKINKYNSSGVFQVGYDITGQGYTPYAITYDGTHLRVINANVVYKYTLGGALQSGTFSVSSQDNNAHGLTFDGTDFWMCGRTTDKMYRYNSAGVYQNAEVSLSSQGTSPQGLVWDGSALWTIDDSSSAAFKYRNQIGVANITNTDHMAQGKNNYTRIK